MEYNLASISLSFFFVTLLVSTQNPTLVQADFVTDTCKQTPNFQLCVATLRADPRSKTTDTSVLGLILVDALKVKTIQVIRQIKKLSPGSGSQKGPLKECSKKYNAVLVADIPEAVEALTTGNPKYAENGVADITVEANGCENAFGHSKSPLTKFNKGISELSIVARAIIRLLL